MDIYGVVFHNVKSIKLSLNARVYYAIVAIAIAIAFLFAAWLPNMISGASLTITTNDNQNTKVSVGRHPLTGFPVYEQTGLPQVFGVMIDNNIEAWPQVGLDKAFLVFEAPVEAGISRFLAFFSDEQEVKKIGPVRSARPYFLNWNNELDALYAHVGGSGAALDEITSGGTFDLNQYWLDDYFWRALNRYAPYNVYTSTELLGSYVKNREQAGLTPGRLYETWKFKDAEFSEIAEVKTFSVTFNAPIYVAQWKFDSKSKRYLRFQNKSAHLMEDGTQISADNIVVVVTEVKILDEIGRRSVRTIGEGKVFVFRDGKKLIGTWKKESQSNRLRFYDSDGVEFELNAGVTWVEVIPDESDLELGFWF
ncbi:DUF3048 domain-containing protein [Candidatus Uhrbacteria bacterium]|nr:DUF3048 domain-containing protein [Candidatus Uhrbacteria bacterium]